MRGRVGRSNKKAYCHLLTPPTSVLPSDSRKRLAALEEFSELGDGFKVAMRDLDIRGAGNLLGGEQSGFITDLGFDTYHKILDDTIQELKETEFKDIFAEELSEKAKLIVPDCVIETDLEILIPDTYIASSTERLQLYSTLDNIPDEAGLEKFTESLKDRFGTFPEPVQQLINSVRLRWLGEKLGFEKISLKGGKMRMQFVANNEEYFKSAVFGKILAFVQQHSKTSRMKDTAGKFTLTIENINSVDSGVNLLSPIAN
jgi:transcription-repair coupling factor (superfamily II helicase)